MVRQIFLQLSLLPIFLTPLFSQLNTVVQADPKCVFEVVYTEITRVDPNSPERQPHNLVLYDLQNNVSTKLTNDKFVNDHSTFLPDGNHILFLSDKAVSPYKRLVYGDLVPSKVYEYDAHLAHVSEFDVAASNQVPAPDMIYWMPFQHALLICDRLGRLFSFSPSSHTTSLLSDLGQEVCLYSVIPSARKSLIALEYSTLTNSPQFYIALFNTETKQSNILRTDKRAVSVLDWTPDQNKLLIKDSLVALYDIKSKKSQYLLIPGEGKTLLVSYAKYLSEDVVLLLAGQIKHYSDPQFKHLTYSDTAQLFKFSLSDRRLTQLTNDGVDKWQLSVRFRENVQR